MIPLFVLTLAVLIFRALGAMGIDLFASWAASTRWGLSVMLLFTASAHFTRMSDDLVRMVPAWVPNPRLAVYFTGVCEVLGAIGLILPPVQYVAGIALIVFFVAVFPANIHAARSGATVRGRPVTPLWIRAPMQVLFIGLTWWTAVATRP